MVKHVSFGGCSDFVADYNPHNNNGNGEAFLEIHTFVAMATDFLNKFRTFNMESPKSCKIVTCSNIELMPHFLQFCSNITKSSDNILDEKIQILDRGDNGSIVYYDIADKAPRELIFNTKDQVEHSSSHHSTTQGFGGSDVNLGEVALSNPALTMVQVKGSESIVASSLAALGNMVEDVRRQMGDLNVGFIIDRPNHCHCQWCIGSERNWHSCVCRMYVESVPKAMLNTLCHPTIIKTLGEYCRVFSMLLTTQLTTSTFSQFCEKNPGGNYVVPTLYSNTSLYITACIASYRSENICMLPSLELAKMLVMLYLFFKDGAKPILNKEIKMVKSIKNPESKTPERKNRPMESTPQAPQKRKFDHSTNVKYPTVSSLEQKNRISEFGDGSKKLRVVNVEDLDF